MGHLLRRSGVVDLAVSTGDRSRADQVQIQTARAGVTVEVGVGIFSRSVVGAVEVTVAVVLVTNAVDEHGALQASLGLVVTKEETCNNRVLVPHTITQAQKLNSYKNNLPHDAAVAVREARWVALHSQGLLLGKHSTVVGEIAIVIGVGGGASAQVERDHIRSPCAGCGTVKDRHGTGRHCQQKKIDLTLA